MCVCMLIGQLCLTLCNPWTIARRAPLSMELSRQEYCSGLPFPSPGELPDPGIKLTPPASQTDSLPSVDHLSLQGSLHTHMHTYIHTCMCVYIYIFEVFRNTLVILLKEINQQRKNKTKTCCGPLDH